MVQSTNRKEAIVLPQCHFFELGRFFNLCLLRVSCRAGDKVVFIIDIDILGFSRFFQGTSRRKPTCTIRILQVAIAPCPSIRAANLFQIGHHAACFPPSRRRSGLRRGVARNRMRTEAGKMPGSLISPIRNGLGVSHDRFGFIHLAQKVQTGPDYPMS